MSKLIPRPEPVLVVSCPDCGASFHHYTLQETDERSAAHCVNKWAEYARQGYTLAVMDYAQAPKLKLCRCKHEN